MRVVQYLDEDNKDPILSINLEDNEGLPALRVSADPDDALLTIDDVGCLIADLIEMHEEMESALEARKARLACAD